MRELQQAELRQSEGQQSEGQQSALEQVSGGWTLAEYVAGYTIYDRWPIMPIGVTASIPSTSVSASGLNSGDQTGRLFTVMD